MSEDLQRLMRSLGYEFQASDVLRQALTHRSAGDPNYERLEFLGDGLLNFIIAEELYRRFPRAPEGDLSRLRAAVVRGECVAEVARTLALGDFLILGSGELKSGGFRRRSILADAMEAVIGAVYLDGGFDAVRGLVLAQFRTALDRLPDVEQLKDPKTRLQEWLQSRRLRLPEYEVIAVHGQAHEQTFEVSCRVTGVETPLVGSGSSRRKAEQAAARRALTVLTDSRAAST